MIILAIETSCDDTSLAIFEDDVLLSMDTRSQIRIHNITGWVVPEIAAREHANVIFDVLDAVLQKSGRTLQDIDVIGVTAYPGLIPSLLTGLTVAKTLGKILQKPVIEVNHIQAHIFANYLERQKADITYPLVCLTVSWWHNDIYFMKDMWSLEKIWTSWDDAAGESYDKVAKMMWLGYPWWPIISEYATEYTGNTSSSLFPRVWLKKDEYNFSFSWLKSAVKREIDARKAQNNWELEEQDKREISYEFQSAVNEVLSQKLIQAAKDYNVLNILLAGWVSANDDLKWRIAQKAWENAIGFLSPTRKIFCMDNAAMVWILTYYMMQNKH